MSLRRDVSALDMSEIVFKLDAAFNFTNSTNSSSTLDDPERISTALFMAPLWKTHFIIAVMYCFLTMFIVVVGTFGNVAIIIINTIDNSMNNIGRIFIINIAIGDLCVSSLAEPLCIVGVYYGEAWFDQHWFLCEFVAILCFIACIGCYLSFVLRAVNRYIFLCHQVRYYDIYTTGRAIVACIICWIVAAIVDSANFLGWGNHNFDRKSHRCVWDRKESFSYTMTIGGVLLLPLPLTTGCFILIFREIFERKKSVLIFKEGNGYVRYRAFIETLRTSRTLLVGFIVFLVLWAPAGVLVMVDFSDVAGMQVYLFTVMLAHLHSCADFIINITVDRKFRKNLVDLITKRRMFSTPRRAVGYKVAAKKTEQDSTRLNIINVTSSAKRDLIAEQTVSS